jgi:single-strand DNA-binding protein
MLKTTRAQNFIIMLGSFKNFVHLMGKTGRDVELVTFDSGNQKATVSLATDTYYTNTQGEKVKNTEWHNLVVWGKLAKVMHDNVKKGNDLAVQGKLTYRAYTDKNGVGKTITEIVVSDFYKISKNQLTTENSMIEERALEEALPF